MLIETIYLTLVGIDFVFCVLMDFKIFVTLSGTVIDDVAIR